MAIKLPLKGRPALSTLERIQPHESTAAHTHDWPLHLHHNRFSAKSFILLPDASAANHFGLFDTWGEVCCTSPFCFLSCLAFCTSIRQRATRFAAVDDSSYFVSRKGCASPRDGTSAMFASVGILANHMQLLMSTSVRKWSFMMVPATVPKPVPLISA